MLVRIEDIEDWIQIRIADETWYELTDHESDPKVLHMIVPL